MISVLPEAGLHPESAALLLEHFAGGLGSVEPTATFDGPLEVGIRLLSGRLKPQYTPAGVEVTGNVSLEDLRKVFPGY